MAEENPGQQENPGGESPPVTTGSGSGSTPPSLFPGNGNGSTPPPPPPPSLTPEQVESMVQERLSQATAMSTKEIKSLQKTLADLKTQYEDQGKTLTGYQSIMENLNAVFNQDPGSPADEYEKSLVPPEELQGDPRVESLFRSFQRQNHTYNTTLSTLMQELEQTNNQLKSVEQTSKEERDRREAADAARRQAEVNRFLSRVAVEEDAVDPVAVERYFTPLIEWENEQLMLRKGKDELVNAETGIKEMFPAYLRKSRAPDTGGAGSGGHLTTGGLPGGETLDQKIESLKTKAEDIKTNYQKNGGPINVLAERRALVRQIQQLEQEKAAAA